MARPSKGERHAVKTPLAYPVRQRLLEISQDAGARALGPFIGDLLACSVGLPELCLELHQDALPLQLDTGAPDVLPLPIGSLRPNGTAVHSLMVRLPIAVYNRVFQCAADSGTTLIGPYIADWCACYVGLPELARGPVPQDFLPLTVSSTATDYQEAMAITA